MLSNITQIAKIESLLVKLSNQRFQGLLPVNIDVKEKLEPQKYLLQVGKKEMQTQSSLELEVGKKYWGMMKEDIPTKSLTLSKLLQKPQLLQHKKGLLPQMDVRTLQATLESEKPKEMMKFTLLEKLSTATTKQEFLSLSNMLQALHENVFTFVLAQEGKETLFQFKKRSRKKESQERQEDATIDFYAAFEHLGPIEGVVEIIDGVRKLSLYLYYENSLKFLQKELKELDLEGFLYQKEGKISPLYEYGESLLDLKG